ncbi:MAG: maleylpyruvate isomerase family mycothiol-dependent enzyme [Acidimicrobiia bacterium]
MEWTAYLEHIGSNASRLSEVAALGLEPAVPCCPGWTVRDLVAHVGSVYAQKAAIVDEGRINGQPDRVDAPDEDLVEWFDESATHLVEILSAHDPAEPIWTFYPQDQTVGFWYRRLAQESLIHRIDGEQAHGIASEVDQALATDGVDEVLTRIAAGGPPWGTVEFADRVARLEVPGQSWTVKLGLLSGTSPRSGKDYVDVPVLELVDSGESLKTVVSGSAGTMDCWLWGRARLGDLTIQGDRLIAASVRAVAKRST